ncbi:MAG: translation initiation factor IF-2, partial [Dehalococcoidia bacterium]
MSREGSAGTTPQALPATITVRDLADRLGVSGIDIIKELIKQGIMANINQAIDYGVAATVAQALGFQTEMEAASVDVLPTRPEAKDEAGLLQLRAPVVAILGHVDHGKTTLLDAIRRTNVAAREAGGITQHIGAYQVEVDGQHITFLDTPGHEAFTAMRARGAHVTDIAVIVVAADDGIMPQTVEAIDHAKAAVVPIIVAINKMDLPGADPERVKQQLVQHGLVIEEWGGDVIAVVVSAKTGQGLKDLLDSILVVAEVSELRANPQRPAVGTIVEAELDSSRGPMATVLVQDGTLQASDVAVAGHTSGKVRAMFNEWGRRVKEAGPSVPVKVLGLESVPLAGDAVEVVESERQARTIAEERREQREAQGRRGVRLEALYGEVAAGKVKELNIILKTDVQGSIEPIRSSLER